MGIKVGQVAKALSTHPPGQSVPGVQGLRYGGAFPVSKIEVEDDDLAVSASLFAYSSFQPWSTEASAVPSITFSMLLTNPTNESLRASFSMFAPLLQEKDQGRIHQDSAIVVAMDAPPDTATMQHPPVRQGCTSGWLLITTPRTRSALAGCGIRIPAGWGSAASRSW